MVRPSSRRGDDDLGPVTDMTGRVEGRTVIASSRGVRGRHSTSDLPVKLSILPNHRPYLLDLDLPSNLICLTHLYSISHIDLHIHFHTPQTQYIIYTYMLLPLCDLAYRIDLPPRSLYWSLEGEADERGDDDGGGGDDDDGNGGDDDKDKGDDDGDEEQTVYVAPVASTSGSDRHPRHGKGKGLTDSFMSVMSKIVGSRNKRPEVAHDVPAPTQKRKKVKASNWEQTWAAEGGPVDPELIPSYGGHVAGPIWHGHVFIFMLK
ncbi:hypothetical protein M9H77_12447 [Catharanthus roseus]|uniref:Uncharacterized protein n=1 Tax=Catharanthus roseus TaxID=4058 RepID=A0ACC0BHM5_CATRO|nr:hypothetical protein M9H77_12447 [Catharanthus roseus]